MSYATEVIADAPVHYWRCADPGGYLLHDIGSAPVHMHAVGITASLGYSGPNSDGGSLDLALDGSFAATGENVAFAGGALSLEILAWSFQHKGAGNQWFNHSPAAGQNSLYNDGVNWRGLYHDVFVPAIGATAVLSQTWQHVVLTYDGVNAQLWVNAIASGSPVAIAPQAAGTAQIGLSNGVNNSRGFISEAAYYDHALSPSRVTAHFLALDRASSSPVYQASGAFPVGPGGGVIPPGQDLSAILAAVRRNYQN